MNEILKYTFTKDTIEVVDGELVMGEPKEMTAYFTLKIRGMALFEMEYGKPLLNVISSIIGNLDNESMGEVSAYAETGKGISNAGVSRLIIASEGLLDAKFIRALASASYTKIDQGIPLNTESTLMEFKQSEMYDLCLSDYDFVGDLLGMAVSCLNDNRKKKNQNNTKRKN